MKPPAYADRLYRLMLRLYPAEFRARFGDEMVQLFGDQLRDARAAGGTGGAVRTWLRTLGDLVMTAPSEHLQRDRSVAHSLALPPSAASRALGVLGILGGLVLVAGYVPSIDWGGFFVLRLVIFNAGAIAIAIAVHRRQAMRSRYLSLATAGLAVLGNAWYLVMVILGNGRPQFPEPDPEFRQVFFLAAIALWLGDAIFALVALRLGAVSRWASAALVVGSLAAFLAMGALGDRVPWLVGLIDLTTPFHWYGVALCGLGWILLGIDVTTRRRPAPASALPLTTSETLAAEPFEAGAEPRG